jgi:hypothetical protein
MHSSDGSGVATSHPQRYLISKQKYVQAYSASMETEVMYRVFRYKEHGFNCIYSYKYS